jgi:Cys-tRNA(Pro)/Cys-tRNA(Cys) deacylase
MLGMKTNAARKLDELGVAYELREYDLKGEEFSAEAVAASINLPAEIVFKTLVLKGDKGVCMAVIPGNKHLDQKALAQLSGNKKVEMVAVKDVLPLTGYIRGGVTALAVKKPYPVFVDASAAEHEKIAVSAGKPGAQLFLNSSEYIKAVQATLGKIATDK